MEFYSQTQQTSMLDPIWFWSRTQQTSVLDSIGFWSQTQQTSILDPIWFWIQTQQTSMLDPIGFWSQTQQTSVLDSIGFGSQTQQTSVLDPIGFWSLTQQTSASSVPYSNQLGGVRTMTRNASLKQPCNYYIASLAFSDLLVGFVYPLYNISHLEFANFSTVLGKNVFLSFLLPAYRYVCLSACLRV
ncbi:hypothetical protein CHS0354_002504 [Potamilus streckersoni]|uniref:G-protein coupled receptors family 1 profile domain-containing protein n=1 Tax=Potamilus streckersoni TaxID=2493646 RepID=A0AAE0SRX9_9BIVA|nr:hypothetical protein CHS0354_002504 [Potamilus streckersoni]